MHYRWVALATLFFARLGMGYQYQTVASSAPALKAALGLGVDQIGLLIGIYFVTGLVLTLPGPLVAARVGEKRCVIFALLLMVLGSVLAATLDTWPAQLLSRVLSGTGGVLMNVLVTKMVADLFVGHEIATAMAILVTSWPAGVALALLVVPLVVATFGLTGVFLSSAGLCALGALSVLLLYREAPRATTLPKAPLVVWPTRTSVVLVLLAGLVWAFFNGAFATIFSFGPLMLADKGMTNEAAGALVSLVLWLSIISVPLGGVVADKTGRPSHIIWLGAVTIAAAIFFIARATPGALEFIVLGLIVGLPAGAIVALPSSVLDPKARTTGMALFYFVFYVIMVVAPVAAGRLAQAYGSIDLAFVAGGWLMIFGLASFLVFQLFRRNLAIPTAASRM